jgi:S-disulfanyl-L-cysteine oxidoreductase SoxD
MFNWRKGAAAGVAAAVLLGAFAASAQGTPYAGIGRSATPAEVAAWDIDVRPDFKGLPKGAGSVAAGMDIWESKCASCHGVFGESNEVFSPIVGGTTKADMKTGRVARLDDRGYPGRTTLMKLSTVSTLWDYIARAMPWNNPKSLKPDEVYAVTAYILNLGGIVPDEFTLTDRNIAEVQKLLPNRNGTSMAHGLWPGAGGGARKPDVQTAVCMVDCAAEPKVASFLPDFARDAHGNLAEQNRLVGAQRGADTSRPAAVLAFAAGKADGERGPRVPAAALIPVVAKATGGGAAAPALALLNKHACSACHGVEHKIIGPSFRDVAKKYATRSDAAAYLSAKIKSGGAGVWGAMPMPPQALGETDAAAIAMWLIDGAKK